MEPRKPAGRDNPHLEIESLGDRLREKDERESTAPRRDTPAHAEAIVERARREARLEWTEERTVLLRAPGFTVVELPGLGWALVELQPEEGSIRAHVYGELFSTAEEAQAEALSNQALELALRTAEEEGCYDWTVSDAFHGKARDNVVGFTERGSRDRR